MATTKRAVKTPGETPTPVPADGTTQEQEVTTQTADSQEQPKEDALAEILSGESTPDLSLSGDQLPPDGFVPLDQFDTVAEKLAQAEQALADTQAELEKLKAEHTGLKRRFNAAATNTPTLTNALDAAVASPARPTREVLTENGWERQEI